MPQRQLQAIRQCGGLQTLWCVAQCSYPLLYTTWGGIAARGSPYYKPPIAAMMPYYRANKPY